MHVVVINLFSLLISLLGGLDSTVILINIIVNVIFISTTITITNDSDKNVVEVEQSLLFPLSLFILLLFSLWK